MSIGGIGSVPNLGGIAPEPDDPGPAQAGKAPAPAASAPQRSGAPVRLGLHAKALEAGLQAFAATLKGQPLTPLQKQALATLLAALKGGGGGGEEGVEGGKGGAEAGEAGAALKKALLQAAKLTGGAVAAALLAQSYPPEAQLLTAGALLQEDPALSGELGELLSKLVHDMDPDALADLVRNASSEQKDGLAKMLMRSPALQARVADVYDGLPTPELADLTGRIVNLPKGAEQGAALSRMLQHLDGDTKIALMHELRDNPLLFNNYLVIMINVPEPPFTQSLLEGLCPCNTVAVRQTLEMMKDPDREKAQGAMALLDLWALEQDADYQKQMAQKAQDPDPDPRGHAPR